MKFKVSNHGYGIKELEDYIAKLESEGKYAEAFSWRRQLVYERTVEEDILSGRCQKCGGEGYLYDLVANGAYPCKCRFDSEISELFGERFKKADFGDFEGSVLRQINKLLSGPSFAIVGVPGSGKTRLLAAIYRESRNASVKCLFRRFTDMVTSIRESADGSFESLIQKLKNDRRRIRFLLDDIGVGEASPFISERLYRLADTIYTCNHQCIFTTNYDSQTLIANLGVCGNQIMSRISLSKEVLRFKDSVRKDFDGGATWTA